MVPVLGLPHDLIKEAEQEAKAVPPRDCGAGILSCCLEEVLVHADVELLRLRQPCLEEIKENFQRSRQLSRLSLLACLEGSPAAFRITDILKILLLRVSGTVDVSGLRLSSRCVRPRTANFDAEYAAVLIMPCFPA